MKRFVWVVIGVLAFAGDVSAFQYEIPLPKLKGVYSTGDLALFMPSDIPLNPPVAFDHIDAVYLDITGNIAPARYRTQLTNGTPGSEFDEYPALTFSLGQFVSTDNSSPWSVLSNTHLILSETGPFHTREAFVDPPAHTPDWSFLQSGQAIATFYLQPKFNSPEDNLEQLIPAIAAITDARLIIEGTLVPEPTSALLALPGVLILARRARR